MSEYDGMRVEWRGPGLPVDFGSTTVVLGIPLDDMSRRELYSVIRLLSYHLPLTAPWNDAAKETPE